MKYQISLPTVVSFFFNLHEQLEFVASCSNSSLIGRTICFLNLWLEFENYISNTNLYISVFLIKTFQCNLERINESADMQAKVRSDFFGVPCLCKYLVFHISFAIITLGLKLCFGLFEAASFGNKPVQGDHNFIWQQKFLQRRWQMWLVFASNFIPINLSCLDWCWREEKNNSKKVLNVLVMEE